MHSPGTTRMLRVGDSGLLVEVDTLEQVIALNRALVQQWPDGVLDVIPAARTLLVRFDPKATDRQVISRWVRAADVSGEGPGNARGVVEIPVRYDGADLDDVGRKTGLAPAEVISLHVAAEYTVAFCGFSPGFAYLTGLPTALHVPRRSSPRTAVPAGAVGLAGEFTGVYPRESPGGWQLVGRTDAVLFDVATDPPTSLTPGTIVRFVEVSG